LALLCAASLAALATKRPKDKGAKSKLRISFIASQLGVDATIVGAIKQSCYVVSVHVHDHIVHSLFMKNNNGLKE
jgi:hypothetical protein